MSEAPAPIERRPVHPAFRLLGFIVLLALFATSAGMAWRLLGLPRPIQDDVVRPLPMLGTSLALLLASLVATWIALRFVERRGFGTLGLGGRGGAPGVGRRIAIGFVGGGLTPALVVLGFAAAGIAAIAPAEARPLDFLAITAGLVAVSSWEEIFLRGYVMQLLSQWGGPWTAVIVSGGVFGAIHAGNPGANPAGLVITGVNGVLLALLVVRTGSLWMACAYHTAWNVVASVGFGLRDSGMVHAGSLAVTDLTGPVWLTGGAYGFEASWITGVVEALVLVALLYLAPRWARDAAALPFYLGWPRREKGAPWIGTRPPGAAKTDID
jgi:membrane protease YdiL (CAAX protease family)